MRKNENSEYEKDCHISIMIAGSSIMQQFLGKRDKYGEFKMADILADGDCAGMMAEDIGGDAIITEAIYYGVEMASPAYEEIGEEFLKETVPEYTKADYGVELMKGIIGYYESKRKEKIYQGIYDILAYGKSDIYEAKIVMLKKEMLEKLEILDSRRKRNSIENGIEMCTIEDILKTEEIKMSERYDYNKYIIKAMKEHGIGIRNTIKKDVNCKQYLEKLYDYFMKNYNEIPDEFIKMFNGMGKNKLVAYYVSTRPETGIEKFVNK